MRGRGGCDGPRAGHPAAFEGVRRAYLLLLLSVMEAMEALGTDRALEMLQRAAEKQADIVAGELRRGLPDDLGPLDLGLEAHRRFMGDAGAAVEVHRRGDASVVVRVGRCPFYEALLDVGVDCGHLLNGLCRNLILPALQAVLRRLDPRLGLEAEMMRRSAEEFCLERIHVTEA